jgi:hypothetical protein
MRAAIKAATPRPLNSEQDKTRRAYARNLAYEPNQSERPEASAQVRQHFVDVG